jgi:glycosyltransferase involved in cell wall biosynthesis
MTVSVVIPLFNKVRHIERAVRSVLVQTHTHFELVVVDDGSTDGSGDVVRRIYDPRLRLVSQDNRGECDARNRGLDETNEDLIAFLDADDEWFPRFLETVLGLTARHPEAGMFATAYCLGYSDRLERPTFLGCPRKREGGLVSDYFKSSLGAQPVTSSSVLIPRRVLDAVGRFPSGVRAGGDLHTWTRIALRYAVAWSPVDGAVYHLSADNRVSQAVLETQDLVFARPIEEFLGSGVEPTPSREGVVEYLVFQRLRLALVCCVQGRRAWARELLRNTKATATFRARRRGLQALVWVPSPLLRLAIRWRVLLRQLSVRTGMRGEPELL